MAEIKTPQQVARHEFASAFLQISGVVLPIAVSAIVMARAMQDGTLGRQFGASSGVAVNILNATWSALHTISAALQSQTEPLSYKNLISFCLDSATIFISSSLALAGFAAGAQYMGADTGLIMMDADFVFPLLVLIAAFKTLSQKSHNGYVKKLLDSGIEAGLSIVTGALLTLTTDKLHAFLSAVMALFTATASNNVATLMGKYFINPPNTEAAPENQALLTDKTAEDLVI